MPIARRPIHALLVCAWAAVATAPGQTLIVALFYAPLGRASGLDATGLSAAYLVATMASAFTMPAVGRWSDRIGPHRLMAAAAVGLGAGCAAVGLVQGPLSLTLVFFTLRLFGQGALMLSSAHTLAMWYHEALGRAEGVRGALLWLGFAALPPLVVPWIEAVGAVWAYASLGLVVVGLTVPAAWWLGAAPAGRVVAATEPATGGYTPRQAMAFLAFWTLTAQYTLVALGITALTFHLLPVFAGLGVDASVAASALTASSLGACVGMIGGGYAADRVDERAPIALAGLLCALGSAALGGAAGAGVGIGAMGLFGLGQGLNGAVVTTAMARWFGRAHHGAIRGLVSALVVAGTSVGPLLLSAGHTASGGWRAPALCLAAGFALTGAANALVRRPPPPGAVSEARA